MDKVENIDNEKVVILVTFDSKFLVHQLSSLRTACRHSQ